VSWRRLLRLAPLAVAVGTTGCSVPFLGDDDGPSEAERLARPPDLIAGEARQAASGGDTGGGQDDDRVSVEPRGQGGDPAQRLSSDGGMPVLDLPLPPDAAWTATGRALERSGFAVDERDADARAYTLRYDPFGEPEEGPGLLSRIAFWRADPVPRVDRYRLALEPRGGDTRLRLLGEGGEPASPEVARQVLTVLAERLRP